MTSGVAIIRNEKDREQLFRDLIELHPVVVRDKYGFGASTIHHYKRQLKERLRVQFRGEGLSELEAERRVNELVYRSGLQVVTIEI